MWSCIDVLTNDPFCSKLLVTIDQTITHSNSLHSWFVPKAHSHTQPFYGSIPYLLHPSTTIHGILPVQSMHRHVTIFFHNLAPSFLWSTSWPGTLHFILHTLLHPIIVFFLQHMPIPSHDRNLFHCSTDIMSSNPSLSLNPLLGILSLGFLLHEECVAND